jgi:hypothetical protein
MNLYDLRDEDGRVFAFEVSNLFLSRRGVCRVVRRIPHARLLKQPPVFSCWSGDEEFCEFEIDGVNFVAWEPFGDNSRYWLGPKPPLWVPQFSPVREAFAQAHRFSLLI